MEDFDKTIGSSSEYQAFIMARLQQRKVQLGLALQVLPQVTPARLVIPNVIRTQHDMHLPAPLHKEENLGKFRRTLKVSNDIWPPPSRPRRPVPPPAPPPSVPQRRMLSSSGRRPLAQAGMVEAVQKEKWFIEVSSRARGPPCGSLTERVMHVELPARPHPKTVNRLSSRVSSLRIQTSRASHLSPQSHHSSTRITGLRRPSSKGSLEYCSLGGIP